MANPAETKKLIENWYKAQAEYEQAQEAADKARGEVQKFNKAIYDALGSQVFTVKAAGPDHAGYRAMHKPARKSTKGKDVAERWDVIPVPSFAPQHRF
jgi:ABC-type nitrate/sulfonate/bicarbonate transport system substrate-binding protein